MDRRLTPATARVAHVSLRGVVQASDWVDGAAHRVSVPLVDLRDAPGGARDRQLLFGEAFLVIDRDAGHAFGRADRDGYCGWVIETALTKQAAAPTHVVTAPATHVYTEPRVQARERFLLPMGAQVAVTGTGTWAETPDGYIPAVHLRPLGQPLPDPVAVAESLLGTPYLWGGNSRGGIDCSGLVQMAHLLCGMACPGDSDLIREAAAPVDGPLQRGDLLFWKGHVAMIVDAARLIHANGHSMSVAHEETEACIARIAAQGGGPVTLHCRLSRPEVSRPA